MSSTKQTFELKDIKTEDANTKDADDQLPEVVIVGGTSRGQHGGAVEDKYKIVFFILLIHGVGTLMPWNMFINAEDYFRKYKLSQTTPDNQEELANLRKNFLSYLGLAAQIPNLLFNGLNLLVNFGAGNLKIRVNLTLALEAIIFAVTIGLAMVDTSKVSVAFFYMTMVSVVVLNMASGIYQNCIFGTGAKFPGIYTNAILIGSNLSGTFTSTINLLSIWLAPAPQEAAIYYFVTALFVILICIISYNILPSNAFFRLHDQASQQTVSDKDFTLEIAQIGTAALPKQQQQHDEIPESLRSTVDAMVPRPTETNLDGQQVDTSFVGELHNKWIVFMKCWPQCLNVFLTFFVTLALFPAVMADIKQSEGGAISEKYFTSFACFFLFNVFAMVGNLISGWTTWPGKKHVWILVVARLLFVPYFLFCNFAPASRHWPVLIGNDYAYMLGNVLLALSSGYLSSLCMMFASSDLGPDEAPKGGMLAAFFLVLGIFLGINSSFFLTWIVELG